jgi:hypothetical protein
MSRRPKRRGHFCWCCGRARANERFSGRGHARHVCSDCSKLGVKELAYRQTIRDIDRLLDWNGAIRRRQRKAFERFLAHPDERVRRYATKVSTTPRSETRQAEHAILFRALEEGITELDAGQGVEASPEDSMTEIVAELGVARRKVRPE